MNPISRIGLLGFGEVGQLLMQDLRAAGHQLAVWDKQFPAADSLPAQAAARLGLACAASAANAVQDAQLVISAVTAAQDVAAAQEAAAGLAPGAWFLDLNSVSPAIRTQAAQLVAAAGGRFVEAAIMAPIAPRGLASPILLGGAQAEGFLPIAHGLGFTAARVFSARLGAASAAKMCRSVVVKGLESLLLESLLTARHFGVEAAVTESLQALFPRDDWEEFARYMLTRALRHGGRRAEEMREVARTVREAGYEARLSEACAAWQEWASERADLAELTPLPALLDALNESTGARVARS